MKNLATGLRIAALAATVFACGGVFAAGNNPFSGSGTPGQAAASGQEIRQVFPRANDADATAWSLVVMGNTKNPHSGVHYSSREQTRSFAIERLTGTKADCTLRGEQLKAQFTNLAFRNNADTVEFVYSCEPDVLASSKATKKSAP